MRYQHFDSFHFLRFASNKSCVREWFKFTLCFIKRCIENAETRKKIMSIKRRGSFAPCGALCTLLYSHPKTVNSCVMEGSIKVDFHWYWEIVVTCSAVRSCEKRSCVWMFGRVVCKLNSAVDEDGAETEKRWDQIGGETMWLLRAKCFRMLQHF